MRYAVVGGALIGLPIAALGIAAGTPRGAAFLLAACLLGFWFGAHVLEERPKRRGERGPSRAAPVHTRHIPQDIKAQVAPGIKGVAPSAAGRRTSSSTT